MGKPAPGGGGVVSSCFRVPDTASVLLIWKEYPVTSPRLSDTTILKKNSSFTPAANQGRVETLFVSES